MSQPSLPADFRAETYLELNPDVRAAGVDPATHFLEHGARERRAYRQLPLGELPAEFDAADYLDANPDLKLARVDPLDHYRRLGYREGRPLKPIARALRPRIDTPFESDGLVTIHNHDFLGDRDFLAAYQRGVQAAGDDYKWHWRVHIGLWCARSAVRVAGDFVECGVNRGFLSSAVMRHLDWDRTGRTFYLLDTFSGVDERYVSEVERAAGVLERNQRELASGFYTSTVDTVRRNFAEWENKKIVVGTIPDTLAEITSTQIAFAHIDLNCSPPEVAAVDALWDRMPPGAVVLLDDYAYYGYQPQKEGMDAWAAKRGVPIASLPTGQGLIIKG